MIVGPEMIEDTIKIVDLIIKKMKETQYYQKPYVDLHQRTLDFKIRDHAFLKISRIRRLMRFGKSSKLCLRYVGPFEILKRVGAVAYQLTLPLSLKSAHDVPYLNAEDVYP